MYKTILFGLALVLSGSISAIAGEIPKEDPAFFAMLFTEKSVPQNWIFEPANEELTPAILEGIAQRLSKSGGKYERATKSARGWVLDFENGVARARILRAPDNTLVGVFFSKLE